MIHIFLGTKAQLIKMAPVMATLSRRGIEYNFIFSGQHKETIDDLIENFKIKKPDVYLYEGTDITSPTQALTWLSKLLKVAVSGRQLIWKGDRNGIVLNHGDTLSTLIGSFLAKLHGHSSAHVESGLRSFNAFNPFPEEIIRRIVFQFSDVYFCPGQWAMSNLSNIKGTKIDTKENTLLDSVRAAANSKNESKLTIPNEPFGLVSIHRFENISTLEALSKIINIINRVSNRYKLLFIMHKPTASQLKKTRLIEKISKDRIELRPRYDYFEFMTLLKESQFLITDGGSNQEECSYLGTPCLLLRKATEREEGLGKNVILSKFDTEVIDEFIANHMTYRTVEEKSEESPSEIIADYLISLKHRI